MTSTDKLIKRKEISGILSIGDTKLREMISENKLIKPILLNGFKEPLFSFNELQEWIKEQKEKRN
ncbi:MAG: hypothetical protein WBF48_00760 [Halarcobacter sp.]